jgi:two-component response regulator (ARR-B family)
LQKYRLYLKRLNSIVNQQANIAAALGSTDSSYLQMGSLNGLENFHNLNGSGQFHNSGFRSFPPSGLLGRLNTPSGLGMHGLPSSGMTQLGHTQNSSSSTIDQVNFHQVMLHGSHNGSVLQGMPTALELDPHMNGVTHARELSTAIDNRTVFPISSGFPDAKVTISSSCNSLLGVTNNTLMLEQNCHGAQGGKVFGNQSSVSVASLNSEFPSPLMDHNRLNDNWSNAAQSSGIHSNSSPLNGCFKQAILHHNNLRDNMSTVGLRIESNRCDIPSVTSMSTQLQDIRAGIQCQSSLIQISNHAPPQEWDDHNQDGYYRSNVMGSSINSMIPVNGAVCPTAQVLEPKNAMFLANMDFNSIGQSNFIDPLYLKHDQVNKSAAEASLKLKQGLLIDQRKPQGSHISSSFGSLDDIVSEMVKQVISYNFVYFCN